ncbi:pyroglutamyl-peptidase 1-like [Lineus longissimus]|uniref:pyroglutamyl-peptidase 1-like n=1 Tax=Lineus longissimus TaxID=88925 RepID=UPI002B4CBA72
MGDAAEEKETVIVTGFGPFKSHDVNASWSAVKELERLGLDDKYNLVVAEIPVEYDTVNDIIPKMWRSHKPHLVVHVGVSGIARNLTLEQCAHNDGITMEDVKGRVPLTHCCIEGSPKKLTSELQMNVICDKVNRCGCGVTSVVSHDPGRYLCNYIFYKSLDIDPSRTAFIHVPILGNPYTAEELAIGLKMSVMQMLEQLS